MDDARPFVTTLVNNIATFVNGIARFSTLVVSLAPGRSANATVSCDLSTLEVAEVPVLVFLNSPWQTAKWTETPSSRLPN